MPLLLRVPCILVFFSESETNQTAESRCWVWRGWCSLHQFQFTWVSEFPKLCKRSRGHGSRLHCALKSKSHIGSQVLRNTYFFGIPFKKNHQKEPLFLRTRHPRLDYEAGRIGQKYKNHHKPINRNFDDIQHCSTVETQTGSRKKSTSSSAGWVNVKSLDPCTEGFFDTDPAPDTSGGAPWWARGVDFFPTFSFRHCFFLTTKEKNWNKQAKNILDFFSPKGLVFWLTFSRRSATKHGCTWGGGLNFFQNNFFLFQEYPKSAGEKWNAST